MWCASFSVGHLPVATKVLPGLNSAVQNAIGGSVTVPFATKTLPEFTPCTAAGAICMSAEACKHASSITPGVAAMRWSQSSQLASIQACLVR